MLAYIKIPLKPPPHVYEIFLSLFFLFSLRLCLSNFFQSIATSPAPFCLSFIPTTHACLTFWNLLFFPFYTSSHTTRQHFALSNLHTFSSSFSFIRYVLRIYFLLPCMYISSEKQQRQHLSLFFTANVNFFLSFLRKAESASGVDIVLNAYRTLFFLFSPIIDERRKFSKIY